MNPTCAEDWIAVARERAADADALLHERQYSAGSVYLAGYVIECSLKAVLQRRGIPFPKAGSAGHDLRALWKTAGFRLTDLADDSGAKTFFIERWNTDLRYTADPELPISSTELVNAARWLSGWLQNKARRRGTRL